MVRNINDGKVTINEHMRGGDGSVKLVEVAAPAEMYGKVRLYNKIVLEPGCSIGTHQHTGECEIFFILKGNGVYNDNGTEVEVGPGDITLTMDGESHGISNKGQEVLELIAVIPLKQ